MKQNGFTLLEEKTGQVYGNQRLFTTLTKLLSMVDQFGSVTQHTLLPQQMTVCNTTRHTGINIQDQTTGEVTGHTTLYTIQMMLYITVVWFTDVYQDTDLQQQMNLLLQQ